MTVKMDRRSDTSQHELGMRFDADIVTKGLLVQRLSGTVSAIEYLKTNGVNAAIIGRVLSGVTMRQRDVQALDELSPVAA